MSRTDELSPSTVDGSSPLEEARPVPPFPQQKQERPGLEAEMVPAPQYRAAAYRAAGKLEGRFALITGGDSGIGRAVALIFAREGANVAIVYKPEEEVDAQRTRAEAGVREDVCHDSR